MRMSQSQLQKFYIKWATVCLFNKVFKLFSFLPNAKFFLKCKITVKHYTH